jgi:carboxyl-terminal processing protease
MAKRNPVWLLFVLLWGIQSGRAYADAPSVTSEPANPQKTDSTSAGDAQAASAGSPASIAELKKQEEYYELFRLFADTLDQVERNYVQEVDRRELVDAAIEGVMGKLDPYSSYIPPAELAGFRSSIDSEFGGIGVQITLDSGQLKILSPIVGSPAYRHGLQAGDKIFKIDDQPTKGLTLDTAVKLLKGRAGTKVRLNIQHPDQKKSQDLAISREMIQVETVLGDRRKPDDSWNFLYDNDRKIGYMRLSAFSRETAQELRAAIEQVGEANMSGLILDLRFNPGGLLGSAIEISDMFLSEGKIVSTEGRNTKPRVWNAKPENTFAQVPLVVLVNRYSASASEIVAACLQDHGRATIVGERTWGKGSVQNIIELEGGKSALILTTAAYQRPSGKPIHRFPDAKDWGVTPTAEFNLPLSDDEAGALLRYRRQRDIVVPRIAEAVLAEGAPPEPVEAEASNAGLNSSPAAGNDAFVDRQLQKALYFFSREMAKK